MDRLTEEDPPSIGGFELCARLGEGGLGRVYLGLSPGGQPVAVKVLWGKYAGDREFLRAFGMDLGAARQVNGMYTAPVVAAGLDDRPPWLATTFVPGPSLETLVSRHGPLPVGAVWRLLAGLVEALRVIYAYGLVLADLKPANVVLATDGPHVTDFWISRAVGARARSAGTVLGTAPEQAEGREAGPPSDVFALGCVLAYAATGVLPFGSGSAASVLYRVVHAAPALDGVPARLRGLIDQCLAKAPAARPSLADLASVGWDGPDGGSGQSSALFWPAPVERVILNYQGWFEAAVTARMRAGSAPAPRTGLSASFPGLAQPPGSIGPTGAHPSMHRGWRQPQDASAAHQWWQEPAQPAPQLAGPGPGIQSPGTVMNNPAAAANTPRERQRSHRLAAGRSRTPRKTATIAAAAALAVVGGSIAALMLGGGSASSGSAAKNAPAGAIATVRQLTTGASAKEQRAAVAPALATQLPSGQLFPAGTSFTPQPDSWAQSGDYAHLTGTLREPGAASAQVEIGLMLSGGRWLVTFEEPA